jgi:hypothetical protein
MKKILNNKFARKSAWALLYTGWCILMAIIFSGIFIGLLFMSAGILGFISGLFPQIKMKAEIVQLLSTIMALVIIIGIGTPLDNKWHFYKKFSVLHKRIRLKYQQMNKGY